MFVFVFICIQNYNLTSVINKGLNVNSHVINSNMSSSAAGEGHKGQDEILCSLYGMISTD